NRDDLEQRPRPVSGSELEPNHLLGPLLGAATANRAVIAASLEESLGRLIEGKDEVRAYLAAEVALYLENFTRWMVGVREVPEEWSRLSDLIHRDHFDAVRRLARSRLTLAYRLLANGLFDADEFLERFGLGGFFEVIWFAMSRNDFRKSYADDCLYYINAEAEPGENPGLTRTITHLTVLGKAAIEWELPWCNLNLSKVIDFTVALEVIHDNELRNVASPDSIGPSALFGAFVALAVKLEAEQEGEESPQPLTIWLSYDIRPITVALRPLLLERFGYCPPEVSWQDALGCCRFTPEQDAFVRRWIAGEVSFISRGDSKAHPRPKRTRRSGSKHRPPKGD
ncbi:MAG TPA: hypothetical protein VF590_25300, partial [Isosphaeraceae bacterium]